MAGHKDASLETFEQFVMRSLELDEEFPKLSEYTRGVWEYFCELNLERGMDGSLNSLAIMAWGKLSGITLERWELRAIRSLDLAHIRSTAE